MIKKARNTYLISHEISKNLVLKPDKTKKKGKLHGSFTHEHKYENVSELNPALY